MYSSALRNCRITSSKMGSINLRVERLQHGVDVLFDESETANTRTMNTKMRVGSAFAIDVVFVTYEEASAFRAWMRRWASIAVSTGTNPLRIEVPARNFDRIGVYQTGVTYGDTVGTVARRMSLNFIGARDPLDVNDLIHNSTDVSYFIAAQDTKQVPDAPFFYPWTSISSTSDFSADQGLYGTPAPTLVPPLAPNTNPTNNGRIETPGV